MASDGITPLIEVSGSVSDDLECQGDHLYSPVACMRVQGGMRAYPSSEKSEVRDRRNEFYSLKRFILVSLGIPTAPAMNGVGQKVCTCIAVPFYASLFIWGILLMGISALTDGYLWKLKCPAFIPARFFTVMAGFFFILLGLYWLLLLWWNRYYQSSMQAHHKSFSVMALLWWFLCIYFTIVATGLATQIVQFRDITLSAGASKTDNFVDCGSHSSPSSSESDVIHVPNNLVPMWALCTMLALLLVNVCVFIANAITLCRT